MPSTTSTSKDYPFHGYIDYSQREDPDPLTPLTPFGRDPNFLAKMHAMLSSDNDSDFHGIITWLPHGRSWRIQKPREFEVKVLPLYFDHDKLSSFIRQANGWGFRRIIKGKSRNSYYHPLFLRGLPHLCKGMKRPRPKERKAMMTTCKQEPDLEEIERRCPLPKPKSNDTSMLRLEDAVSRRKRAGESATNTATRDSSSATSSARPLQQLCFNSGSMASLLSAAIPHQLPLINEQCNKHNTSPFSSAQIPTPDSVAQPQLLGSNNPLWHNLITPASSHTSSPTNNNCNLAAIMAANQVIASSGTLPPQQTQGATVPESATMASFMAGVAAAMAYNQQQLQGLYDQLSNLAQQEAESTNNNQKENVANPKR